MDNKINNKLKQENIYISTEEVLSNTNNKHEFEDEDKHNNSFKNDNKLSNTMLLLDESQSYSQSLNNINKKLNNTNYLLNDKTSFLMESQIKHNNTNNSNLLESHNFNSKSNKLQKSDKITNTNSNKVNNINHFFKNGIIYYLLIFIRYY